MRAEGLAGLSLRELAKRVGMQAPSLYAYFGSKAAIYDAMFVEGCEELDARRTAMEHPTDARTASTSGSTCARRSTCGPRS